MKALLSIRALTLLLALLALAGCATRNKIDWSARIGTYTFDQAILDFGPPTKQAKLTDGTIVAEWQTERAYAQTYYPPYYYGGYHHHHHHYHGHYYGMPTTTYSPDVFLRLTFGPDSKLTAWKRVAM